MPANYFTILCWFCNILQYFAIMCWFDSLTWICHGCTCVPHPECHPYLPPYPIPLDHPSATAPSTLYHASNLNWQSVIHMIIYMFQFHSPKSSHPRPLPQESKRLFYTSVSIYLCLVYRVIVTIFLSSILYALVYCIGVFLSGLLHSV